MRDGLLRRCMSLFFAAIATVASTASSARIRVVDLMWEFIAVRVLLKRTTLRWRSTGSSLLLRALDISAIANLSFFFAFYEDAGCTQYGSNDRIARGKEPAGRTPLQGRTPLNCDVLHSRFSRSFAVESDLGSDGRRFSVVISGRLSSKHGTGVDRPYHHNFETSH